MKHSSIEMAAVAAALGLAMAIRYYRSLHQKEQQQSKLTDAELLEICERQGETDPSKLHRSVSVLSFLCNNAATVDSDGLAAVTSNDPIASLETLDLILTTSFPDLSNLQLFTALTCLTLECSQPLSMESLQEIGKLKTLRRLNLSKCQVCVDDNHVTAELCSAQAVFDFARKSSHLKDILLPPWFTLRLGTVTRCYAKAGVAVVSLSLPAHVGDVVQLRRVQHNVTDDNHEWRSELGTISSIRDGHGKTLSDATPTLQEPQFALGLQDVGKKNDGLYWMGAKNR